jgi:hypothetical protein
MNVRAGLTYELHNDVGQPVVEDLGGNNAQAVAVGAGVGDDTLCALTCRDWPSAVTVKPAARQVTIARTGASRYSSRAGTAPRPPVCSPKPAPTRRFSSRSPENRYDAGRAALRRAPRGREGALDESDLLGRRTRVGLFPADRERALPAARQALAGNAT